MQIAIGTKTGEILIYDLASSSLIETIKAHTASVWSLHVRPDEQAIVSGSADKDVKFWEFESKDGKEVSVSVYLDSLCAFPTYSAVGAEREIPHTGSHPDT